MYMGSVYVNVMIFVFLYMIFALVATAKRMRKERRNSNYNISKNIRNILNMFYAVNNFYVLNLIYTYYTPIYNEWNGITNENQEKYSIYNNKSNNKK